jgi:hypothetical protein
MPATEIPRRRELQWPRSRAELEREWSRVDRLATRIAAAGAVNADELRPEARCLLGMRAAALWSLGRSTTTPMTGRADEPTFYAALEEMRAADELIRARSPGWAWAIGVDRWLSWLIGAEESVRAPSAEAG